jgi:YfiH family protein
VDPSHEFKPDELTGAGAALRLDNVAAFAGVEAAFATKRTLEEGPAAGAEPALDDRGRLNEDFVARVAATLAFPYGRLGTARQVHGTTVREHDVAERRWYEGADGLATSLSRAPVAVFTADCVPVLLWAPRAGALAMLHAGWRGTLAKITARGVAYLGEKYRAVPEEVVVFLGPAVGACCYTVGDDVAAAAREAFGRRATQVLTPGREKWRLDLHRGNELAAQEAGVLPGNVYRVDACTACEPALFESYRREGAAAERMMNVALRAEPGERR